MSSFSPHRFFDTGNAVRHPSLMTNCRGCGVRVQRDDLPGRSRGAGCCHGRVAFWTRKRRLLSMFPRRFPVHLLIHLSVRYRRRRMHTVRDGFVRVISASSVAFLTRDPPTSPTAKIIPLFHPSSSTLPSANPIPHAARLSLSSRLCGCPGVCLVFVIGDRRGIDARVRRAGLSPARTNGGSAIGVAWNRPCQSGPVGWNDASGPQLAATYEQGSISGRPLPAD